MLGGSKTSYIGISIGISYFSFWWIMYPLSYSSWCLYFFLRRSNALGSGDSYLKNSFPLFPVACTGMRDY